MFIHIVWRDRRDSFCEALNISQSRLDDYLTGKRDPAEICEELAELGADIHYILTGKHIVSLNELMINDALKDHGVKSASDLRRLLRANKRCKKCLIDEPLISNRACEIINYKVIGNN